MKRRSDPLALWEIPRLPFLGYAQPSPPGAATAALSWIAPMGSNADPPGAAGAVRFLARLLPLGAGVRDAREFARALDRIGAELTVTSGEERLVVGLSGPFREFRRMVELFVDVLTRPRLDPRSIETVRGQLREAQERERSQPGPRAERLARQRLFGPRHPWGRSPLGTTTSLRRIDRRLLRSLAEELLLCREGVLVVTAPRLRRADLGPLRGVGGRVSLGKPTGAAAPQPRASLTFVPLAGRSQSEVRVAAIGVRRSDPLFPAAHLTNEILGGRPVISRLFQRLREERGLAYDAFSRLRPGDRGGLFLAGAGTAPENAATALEELRQQLEEMGDAPPSPDELDRIRESYLREIAETVETTAEAHELAVETARWRLPVDHWKRWPEVLRGVRPEEVRRAASVLFRPSGLVAVVAGPPPPTDRSARAPPSRRG